MQLFPLPLGLFATSLFPQRPTSIVSLLERSPCQIPCPSLIDPICPRSRHPESQISPLWGHEPYILERCPLQNTMLNPICPRYMHNFEVWELGHDRFSPTTSKIEAAQIVQCYEKHLSNIMITGLRFLGKITFTGHRDLL